MLGRVIGLLAIGGIFGLIGKPTNDYFGMYLMLLFAGASLMFGLMGWLK